MRFRFIFYAVLFYVMYAAVTFLWRNPPTGWRYSSVHGDLPYSSYRSPTGIVG